MAKFQPGQSGNPSGRPKVNAEIKELARSFGKEALEKMAALLESDDEKVRLAAAQALLDRGYGKPTQMIAGDDELPPIQVEGRVRLVRPTEGDGST